MRETCVEYYFDATTIEPSKSQFFRYTLHWSSKLFIIRNKEKNIAKWTILFIYVSAFNWHEQRFRFTLVFDLRVTRLLNTRFYGECHGKSREIEKMNRVRVSRGFMDFAARCEASVTRVTPLVVDDCICTAGETQTRWSRQKICRRRHTLRLKAKTSGRRWWQWRRFYRIADNASNNDQHLRRISDSLLTRCNADCLFSASLLKLACDCLTRAHARVHACV